MASTMFFVLKNQLTMPFLTVRRCATVLGPAAHRARRRDARKVIQQDSPRIVPRLLDQMYATQTQSSATTVHMARLGGLLATTDTGNWSIPVFWNGAFVPWYEILSSQNISVLDCCLHKLKSVTTTDQISSHFLIICSFAVSLWCNIQIRNQNHY